MRLHIAKTWEPQDYITALAAIETMYYVIAGPEIERFSGEYFLELSRRSKGSPRLDRRYGRVSDAVEYGREFSEAKFRLYVSRIQHSSPGFIDLEGLGSALDVIDKTIGRLISLLTERRQQQAADERAEIENLIRREDLNGLRIANAREMLGLEEAYDRRGSVMEYQKILMDQQKNVEMLISRGMITGRRDHAE